MIDLDELRAKQANFEGERQELKKKFEKLEKLRKEIVSKFNIESLKTLPIEKYIIGKRNQNTFCYLLETKLKELGNIHGSFAQKFGIFWSKEKERYVLTKKFGEVPEKAYKNVINEVISLIEAGEKLDDSGIRSNILSPMFKGKILSTYFPNIYLNIFSEDHLDYFINKLEINLEKKDIDILDKKKILIEFKNSDEIMRSWFIYEFSNFLYSKFGRPPRIETMPKELRKYVNLSGGNVKEKLIEIEEKEIKKELSQIEEKERDKFIQSEIEKINTKSLANIEEKEIKVRNVKRNHRLYALLKEKYNHQCQICNFTFKKKDGKNYCEACHIEQLSKSRLDNEENILILCSNCHKKLDLGDKTSKKDILEFINSRILEKIS